MNPVPVISVQPLIAGLPKGKDCRQHGFSLFELVVVLAIIAILAAIAIPALSDMVLGSQLRSQANDLSAGAVLARSEAIKRNQSVILCSSANGTSCGGTWTNGWIILRGGTVIKSHEAAKTGYLISSGVTSITFQPSGMSATPATITVCRATPVGDQSRIVTISATGRPRVTRSASSTCS